MLVTADLHVCMLQIVLFLFKMHTGLALTQKQLWDLYNMKEVHVVS